LKAPQHYLNRLRKQQRRLASRVVIEDHFERPVRVVAGFDLAYLNDHAIAAAVSLRLPTLELVERKTLLEEVSFPYIPTFLAFREAPPIINLLRRLEVEPDIIMLDAHGIAHPVHLGCASHVGVLVEKPTIGVAKRLLCGEYGQEPERVGEWVPLTYEGRVVGAVFKSREGCRPIFISPGHMITLKSSIQIVRDCIRGHRLPEPLRLAHQLAVMERRRLLGGRVYL